jgi:uncharacterized membrane protein
MTANGKPRILCYPRLAIGYVQAVDDEQLMRLATQHDLMLQLARRPGDFVNCRAILMRVLPRARINHDIELELRDCFSLGAHRTPHQDAQYMLQQMVEIAVHALSPGINEPFTALTCIDWIGASLRGVARRELPMALRQDEHGRLRVMACTLDFEELADIAFNQIRLYGASNPEVMQHLLEIIGEIAPDVHRDSDRSALVRHARLIGEDTAQIANISERRRLADCLQRTLFALTQHHTQEG